MAHRTWSAFRGDLGPIGVRVTLRRLLLGTVFACAPAAAIACVGGAPAQVVAIDGEVIAIATDGNRRALMVGDRVCAGETVESGPAGRAELRLTGSETTLGLAPNAALFIPDTAAGRAGDTVTLGSGILRFLSSVRESFSVVTVHANAGIDGTEAVIATDSAQTLVVVREGVVALAAANAELAVQAGSVALAGGGGAQALDATEAAALPSQFRALAIDPAGATDWAIYYPPILLAGSNPPAPVAAAAEALSAGDPDRAEALLAGVAGPEADALGAVIAIARGRVAEGAERAANARNTAPDLASSWLATSYAEQAAGDVRGARRAAREAVARAPGDAFARARVAELDFVAGDAVGAEREARAAIAIAPVSLAHAVLGLARLAANDYSEATIAFQLGIQADSEDPLPRLGKGLLLIRQGRTTEGRRELETAAALDPRRAVLRTWLGRAYAAEELPEKALAQYDLAKEADPDDPAPWLLSAETLFLQNRPVEAVREVVAAEERSDGRSVLRNERGLTEDRAVRAAALGRLFETLGFEQQAMNAAARAAEEDPSNAAAQGVLADVLRAGEGQAIASVSAAFAEQVYRGPSTVPIDPVGSESDLTLLQGTGAGRPSFAELSPYFEQDGWRGGGSAFGGTQGTIGNTFNLQARQEGFSAAVSQFHSETEGFRVNNDIRHDILGVELRAQALPWLDFFGEYRYRFTDAGDRTLEFDLDTVIEDLSTELERNLFRFGAHARIGADQDAAIVVTHTVEDTEIVQPLSLGFGQTVTETDGEATDVQGQHIGRFGPVTIVSGFTYADADFDGAALVDTGFGFPFEMPLEVDTEQVTVYTYATYRDALPFDLGRAEVTLGGSVDHVSIEDLDPSVSEDQTFFNPKVGVRYSPTDWLSIRGAWTRTVVPASITQQRLEPTTVAGFVQGADQEVGSRVSTIGVGFDARIAPWLTATAEGTRRRIETPAVSDAFEDTEEFEIRGSLDATLANQFAAGLDVRYVDTESGDVFSDLEQFEYTEVKARLGWFHPEGFFASVSAGVVFHEFEGNDQTGSDTFPVVGLSAGYRLPDQRGIVSVDIQNLTDSTVRFEDRPLQSSSNFAEPRFAREIAVIGRVVVGF
ncbi:MAG: TonB-dependent receptor [Pseudomonadota bacterium]